MRDPDRNTILSTLTQKGKVEVSTLNIWEVGMTKSTKSRSDLLNFLSELAKGSLPLDIPPDIVRKSLTAYLARDKFVDFYIGHEREDIELILANPNQITEDHLSMFKEEHNKLESTFLTTHREARPQMQSCMDDPAQDTPSLEEYVTQIVSEQGIYLGFLNTCINKIDPTQTQLSFSEASFLSHTYPEIYHFFIAEMYSAYKRSIDQSNYGKKNAGNVDIWFAVYLSQIDYFITHDYAQFEAMKFVAGFSHSNCTIFKYDDFKEKVVQMGI